MTDTRGIAALARVLADESRAAMCLAMLDGASWTLTELADVAHISLATASEHVSKLVSAGICSEERAGRNRYVRLAGAEVAHVLETFSLLAWPSAEPDSSLRAVGARRRLAVARTCYDHLAGRLGVVVMDALQGRGIVDPARGLALTSRGERWFEDLDIDIAGLRSQRRAFVRECVDWTEHRPHLAGALGAALCESFIEREWVRRPDRTRRLELTAPGQRALRELLLIEPADLLLR